MSRRTVITVADPGKETSYWTTAVSDVANDDVFIRGVSLGALIGRLPFSAACFLLIRGKMPTPGEATMMDALLCSVLDYSLYKPGTVAARYCVSANPQMVPGLATAVLSVGEYTLSPEDSGRFISEGYAAYQVSGRSMDDFAAERIAALRKAKARIPGFGHPQFRYVDPRAQKLKEIAQANGAWGDLCEWYEACHRAFTASLGKPEIVINEVGMMAAILAQMGFTPQEMAGIAVISSLPGVIAHISEELQSKTRIRVVPDQIASYPRHRVDIDQAMADAGWTRQR